MKKRFIATLAIMLIFISLLCACSSESSTIITSEKTQEVAGRFYLFRTNDAK